MSNDKKPLQEGDYLLTHSGAWFTLKGFSIRLVGTDEGVVVNIYANGRELEDALATTQAFDSEIEEALATEDRALVEAAPDLLHALRDALEIIEGTGLDASIQRAAIAKADARLIAAAPELLAAAQCTLADFKGILSEFDPEREHPTWETLADLRTVIAKATGGAA